MPLTIDAATGMPDPHPREIKLKTANDVRLEMAKVYREMRHGKIETGEGSKLVYVLVQIAKVIETSEIEARMESLERVLIGRKS